MTVGYKIYQGVKSSSKTLLLENMGLCIREKISMHQTPSERE